MPSSDQVKARRVEISAWYSVHRYKCQLFEQSFVQRLVQLMRDEGLLDAHVESRIKGLESLADKACRTLGDDFKYQDPQREITDLVGARVMVPLVTDIEPVRDAVVRRFVLEEESDRGEEEGTVDVPGYRSLHLLVRLSEEDLARPELADFADMIVEIQIRTILQHAWAALQHDMGYKAARPPSPAVRRRITALAGLLELADREFVGVMQQQNETSKPRIVQASRPATPGGKLTTAALRLYVEDVMGEEDAAAHSWYVELARVLDNLAITSIDELTSFLGKWVARAREVTRLVRTEKAWANSALVFDILLRLADGDRYLDAGCAADGWEKDDERARGFFAELAPYQRIG